MKLPNVQKCEPSLFKAEKGKTYAWCTCGLSEKVTMCDGKHKTLAYEENEETVFPYKSFKWTSEEDQEVWLCNCKHTKNPPFCDGSHRTVEQS